MINVKDIQSLTDFKRHTNFYTERLKETGSPLILTVNGRAELVVLDAETYQELLNKVEYAETVQALKEGIDSFERGEGKPARAALENLAKKYDIPR